MKKKIDNDYMDSEISKIDKGDLDVLMNNNEKISDKISGSGALKKYTELGKVMFGMVNDYRKGIYRQVPWYTIATITFSLLYILNPFDIIPDFIPGFGYVDDMTVFAFGLKLIQSDLHAYLEWKTDDSKADAEDEETDVREDSSEDTSNSSKGTNAKEPENASSTTTTKSSEESAKPKATKKAKKVKKPGQSI